MSNDLQAGNVSVNPDGAVRATVVSNKPPIAVDVAATHNTVMAQVTAVADSHDDDIQLANVAFDQNAVRATIVSNKIPIALDVAATHNTVMVQAATAISHSEDDNSYSTLASTIPIQVSTRFPVTPQIAAPHNEVMSRVGFTMPSPSDISGDFANLSAGAVTPKPGDPVWSAVQALPQTALVAPRISVADAMRQNTIMGPTGVGTGGSTEVILSARGAFYMVKVYDKASPGMYAVDELTKFLAQRTTSDVDGTNTPVLLTNAEMTQSDITSEVPCLNNIKVFYTFGQNFGQVQIAGEVLLGPVGAQDQHNRGHRLLREFFYTYRVSVYKFPIKLSVVNESYFVYLKGMRINQVDPNYHTMGFVLFGTLLDLSRENSQLVNPTSNIFKSGHIDESSLRSALMATVPEEFELIETPAPLKTDENKDDSLVIGDGVGGDVGPLDPVGMRTYAGELVDGAVKSKSVTEDHRIYQDMLAAKKGMEISRKAYVADKSTTAEMVLATQDRHFKNLETLNNQIDRQAERVVMHGQNQTSTDPKYIEKRAESLKVVERYGIREIRSNGAESSTVPYNIAHDYYNSPVYKESTPPRPIGDNSTDNTPWR